MAILREHFTVIDELINKRVGISFNFPVQPTWYSQKEIQHKLENLVSINSFCGTFFIFLISVHPCLNSWEGAHVCQFVRLTRFLNFLLMINWELILQWIWISFMCFCYLFQLMDIWSDRQFSYALVFYVFCSALCVCHLWNRRRFIIWCNNLCRAWCSITKK